MTNPLARLYNFRGKLSRRDFLVYWLWVYLLPKVWITFAGGSGLFLYFWTATEPQTIVGGLFISTLIHLLLISFFLGAMWRRLNDIGFALYPKLIICALMIVIVPPYGWILQLLLLMLPARRR